MWCGGRRLSSTARNATSDWRQATGRLGNCWAAKPGRQQNFTKQIHGGWRLRAHTHAHTNTKAGTSTRAHSLRATPPSFRAPVVSFGPTTKHAHPFTLVVVVVAFFSFFFVGLLARGLRSLRSARRFRFAFALPGFSTTVV